MIWWAWIVGRMGTLNKAIGEDKDNLGSGYCIGHSFFCPPRMVGRWCVIGHGIGRSSRRRSHPSSMSTGSTTSRRSRNESMSCSKVCDDVRNPHT